MKLNKVMKRVYMLALLAITVGFYSCDEDALDIVNAAGVYDFGSATLVDGNADDDMTTDLIIRNVPDLVGITPELVLSANETTYTSALVDGVLTGASPCDDTETATYQIDLKADSNLAFICTSEDNLSEDVGSWLLIDDQLTLTVSVSFSPIPIPILLSDVKITDSSISGTIERFPMVKYVLYDDGTPMPVAGPIDGDPSNLDASNLNIQYISIEIVLQKAN